MADAKALSRKAKKLGLVATGAFAVAAAALTLGSGVAGAEVEEISADNFPEVTSRQATIVSESGVRLADVGAARGLDPARGGDMGVPHAQGEIERTPSLKAVPGTTSGAFTGEFTTPGEGPIKGGGPALGDW